MHRNVHTSLSANPPLPSDSFRRNGNIGGGLHEEPQSDCDLDFQNISSLSTNSKSRPAYPVPASSWFCSLDTRNLPTPVSGSGEANPGVWPGGVLAIPTTRHRTDGAHTAPGHTCGRKYGIAAIMRQPSSTEYLFSRASPASRRPHLGLQHIPRSPRLATGGIFEAPSRTRLQVAPPQFSLTPEEGSLLCETSDLVE